MKILSLDTSTATASLALCDGGRPLAEAALAVGRKRGEHLPDAIAWLLSTLGLTPAELEGFAVGLGPGSFTGLRSGLALIKGLALAGGQPVVGVSSLEALAAATGHLGPALSVIDAHKGEVYAAVFKGLGPERPLRLSPDHALLPETLPDLLAASGVAGPYFPQLLVTGDGLTKHAKAIATALPGAAIAPPVLWTPRAAWTAALAGPRLTAGESDPLDPLAPVYVRSTDTELRLGPRAGSPAS